MSPMPASQLVPLPSQLVPQWTGSQTFLFHLGSSFVSNWHFSQMVYIGAGLHDNLYVRPLWSTGLWNKQGWWKGEMEGVAGWILCKYVLRIVKWPPPAPGCRRKKNSVNLACVVTSLWVWVPKWIADDDDDDQHWVLAKMDWSPHWCQKLHLSFLSHTAKVHMYSTSLNLHKGFKSINYYTTKTTTMLYKSSSPSNPVWSMLY